MINGHFRKTIHQGATVRSLSDGTNGKAEFKITNGLTYQDPTLTGNHGVFVYCNRRLIARALIEPELGFVTGQAGIPHHDMNLARIIIEFSGDADNMPWTSKKDAINYNHPSFHNARSDIITVVSNCVKWSKVLKPNAADKVVPFIEGEIKEERLPAKDRIKPSRLPTPPKSRKDYKEDIASANRAIAAEKPWTRGLYESIIAERLIAGAKSLSLRNRISWIILDSIVEIGCKEYRVREMGQTMSAANVKKLTREGLHDEVSQHLLKGDPIWGPANLQLRDKKQLYP